MKIVEELVSVLGEDRVISDSRVKAYSADASIYVGKPPVAVVFPFTTEEVSEVVKIALKYRTPVVARGAGTSVTGAVTPLEKSIIIDFSKMNRILEVDVPSLTATVEPGVVLEDLNRHLMKYGLFFPPDPGSSSVCTIGGMIGTNASGMRGVKYGTTRNYVLGLEVVTGQGKVIKTGSTCLKNSEGVDLTQFFVGTEGTLGIVTKAWLHVLPLEKDILTLTSYFDSYRDVITFLEKVYGRGVMPEVVEAMDPDFLRTVKTVSGMDVKTDRILVLMEIKKDDLKKIQDLVSGFEIAEEREKRENLWKVRRMGYPSVSSLIKGYRAVPVTEDVGVPVSKIPEVMEKVRELKDNHMIVAASFGHLGDGNIHVTTAVNIGDREEVDRLKKFYKDFHNYVLEIGGTVSAEHGMGIVRSGYFDEEQITAFRALKKIFDPEGILNPGKMEPQGPFENTIFDNPPDYPDELQSLMKCTFCGFCRKCPVFTVKSVEFYSPRTKVGTSGYDWDETTFYYCTTCRLCEEVCITGARALDAVKFWRKRIMIPEKFLEFAESIRKLDNPYGEEKKSDVDVEKNREGTILYFMGCTSTLREREIVDATISVLKKLGVDFTVLENEPCCGSILFRVGLQKEAEKNARKVAEAIEEIKPELVITSCAGCYKTLSQDVREVAGLDVPVKHITQFLADVLPELKSEEKMRVTYHDPCHLGRHAGIYEEPREILRKIDGIEFVEMELNRNLSFCCGAGGGLRAFDPELSRTIARERIRQAEDTGAELIISACPFCVANLNFGKEGISEDLIVFIDRVLDKRNLR